VQMTISILGGLGLFLLGMAVMTDGLRALAGSALASILTRAAPTPARGAFWGAVATLIVQSSSATTMTTIGLVSAGLLTFPQALGVVFGANIGSTGTGWLVALLGVKVSLNAAAMPLVFLGALMRLLGRGRWAGLGSAIAGFALLLIGLTVLQEGMAGLATRINPADLPGVSDGWAGVLGVLQLVLAGIVMTTVMQSSSVAVAATLSALHAGAIGPDQAAALVIGQNIGSAVSSGLAAIGATTPAKRTAAAHVLFNVLTALVALAAFPLYAPLIVRTATAGADATILLASFHTVYNVVGVAVLLPLVRPFARMVERLVPQRNGLSVELTRFLDSSVQAVPAVAVEAARRTVAGALRAQCRAVADMVEHARSARPEELLRETTGALEQTRAFLSGVAWPPVAAHDRERLDGTLHAMDHAARFAENAMEWVGASALAASEADAEATRAAALCGAALRLAAGIAARVAQGGEAAPTPGTQGGPVADAAEPGVALADLARRAAELADLRRAHRPAALAAAARGERSADDAMAQVEAVRRLDRLAYHAWRAAAHLVGPTHAPS